MKFLYIGIKGYKTLFLNNIDSISIRPQNDLMILLGRNGCGKTRLLKEFTVLPATPTSYKEGGSKIIIVEHKGNIYKLISYVSKSAKHTLIKNGVTIHSLATTKVHLQAIVNEFNYNHTIHKLLIGELTFTDMEPGDRKEILTTISPLDLDWGYKFYNDLKEQIRDTQGVLKHIVNKNAEVKIKYDELLKVMSKDLKIQKEKVEKDITKLLPFSLMDIKETNNDLFDIKNKLSNIEKHFKKFDNRRVPIDSINNLNDLNNYISELHGNISSTQSTINSLNEELFNLTSLNSEIIHHDLSKNEVIEKINFIKSEITNRFKTEANEYSNHSQILESIYHLTNQLAEIFNVLPSTFIKSSDRDNCYKKLEQLIKERNHKNSLVNSLNEKINHLKNPELRISCPKCQYEFSKTGENVEELLSRSLIDLQSLEMDIKKLDSEYESLNDTCKDCLILDDCEKRLNLIKNIYHNCFDFWTMFKSNDEILMYSDITQNNLKMFNNLVIYSKEKKEIEIELIQYQNTLQLQEKYDKGIDSRITLLNTNIENKRNQLTTYQQELKNCNNLSKYIVSFEEASNLYNQLLKELKEKTIEDIELKIKQEAKLRCNNLYSKIAEYNNQLDKFNNLTRIINELDTEQEEMTVKLKSLKIAEEILSPSTGLIATQMLNFISDYLKRINKVLKQVWSYKLELEPCTMDKGVLTYKFPLRVKSDTTPDVSESSASQEEVINLAFMMTLREYLHLEDYPLYLDETGAKWDEKHRLSLIEYVKSLLVNYKCSQLFFVSHYDSMFGAFTNTDKIVLDNNNITISQPYNTTVTFNEELEE